MAHYELPHMGGSTNSARIAARLIKEIRTGEFSGMERLPSELELAQHYAVSRSVIRDALSDLEREGFVERGRGIGTLIHRNIVNMTNRLDVKFEFFDLVRGAGHQPSSDQVRIYEKKADKALAEALELEEGAPLLVCEKRVLADGNPVIYAVDHLPLHLLADVDYRALDWGGPIFDLLEIHCGISVDTDVAKVSAVMGPKEIREKLCAGPDTALLFVDEIGYYKLCRPILHSYVYYNDFCDFTILRKKI